MALIACRECNHEVSDKASRCPHCGAPTALSATGRRRLKRTAYGLLIVIVIAWAGLTALWITGRITTPSQLADVFRVRDRAVGTSPPRAAVTAMTPPSTPSAATHAVYRTTVEQLDQDYKANAVATQNKIGDSSVRLGGSVADINEDAQGHPIVTLSTGPDAKADMVLNDDQRSAVAQHIKGDTIDLQCERMQRINSTPHGSGCALVLLDAASRQVYLAVFMANGSGSAPAYVVGPMSQDTCLSREDSLAAQLNANPKTDRIALRNCTTTARETIPLNGCHLSTTMSAVPDVPSAHLWKYDCGTPALAAARKPLENRKASQRQKSIEADTPNASDGDDQAQNHEPPTVTPLAISSALSSTAATAAPAAAPPVPAVTPAAAAPAAAPVAAQPAAAEQAPRPGTSSNIVVASSAGSPPTPAPPAPPQLPASADDLTAVRSTDPGAADHIASYCNAATASAADRAAVAAGCRRAEASAWTRLVLNNEFPTLDDATRRKCNEAPFPDSYVAKESCARYQLHIN
jgi:hypothetical protein